MGTPVVSVPVVLVVRVIGTSCTLGLCVVPVVLHQLSFAGITMKVSLGRPSQDVLVCGLDSCVMNLVVSVLHLNCTVNGL